MAQHHMLLGSSRALGRWHDLRGGPRIVPAAPPRRLPHSGRWQLLATADESKSQHVSVTPENCPGLEAYLEMKRKRGNDNMRAGLGKVFLVGTGPGDPGLLTVRALQLLQTADVVLYDRLVSDDILGLVHGGATMVYVGKQSGYHTRSQEEIHEMLLAFAQAGATVVRLKGGDPYVFGRGGEELAYLQQRGVRVHGVPGITAAAGICAELGIPLTHRGVATSVRYLTGHSREGGQELLDQTVRACVDPYTTLVVYMGLQTLPELSAQLLANGLLADTPAVAVERGTTPNERVVYGTLQQLHALTRTAQLQSPTLIVIGEVVALSDGWQEWVRCGRPLVHSSGSAQEQQQEWSWRLGSGDVQGLPV